MKAAAKNEELVVWDENGNVIGSLTDNVPEGALETNPDGSVNTYNADGNKVGTMTAEELKVATTLTDEKDGRGAAGQRRSVHRRRKRRHWRKYTSRTGKRAEWGK